MMLQGMSTWAKRSK